MKEPGKFDLVYHNENGAEVVEYAVTQEKRVGVLLFSGLLGRPFAWLAAGGLEGDTTASCIACVKSERIPALGGSPDVSTMSPYSHHYLPRVTMILT